MATADCPSREQLMALVRDQLYGDTLESVAMHLDRCPACAALVQELDGSVDPFIAALVQPDVVEPFVKESGCARAVARFQAVLNPAEDAPAFAEWQGRYRIGEEIAHGGMGVVYRAQDQALDRPVALKTLKADRQKEHALRRRFNAEARITGQLQHPGVPPVHDLGTLPDGRPFLAMKLIRGQTLAELLRQRPRHAEGDRPTLDDLPRLLSIFEQIAQTLAYVHSQGVIHRDLKPANVMVGAFSEVQVMDWGLAKVLDSSGPSPRPAEEEPDELQSGSGGAALGETPRLSATQAGDVLGTPAYMAPEQARGENDRVTERADVFALGAILCEILTGRPPFLGNAGEALKHSRAGDMEETLRRLERRGADPELIALTRKCLHVEPEQRLAHAGEVAEAVAAYRAGVDQRLRRAEQERAAATARAEAERLRAAAERRTIWWAAGLVATALVTAGVMLGVRWWWAARQAEADRTVAAALAEVDDLASRARAAPVTQMLGLFEEVDSKAGVAAQLVRGSFPSVELKVRTEQRLAQAHRELHQAHENQYLLAQIVQVRGLRESHRYVADEVTGLTLEPAPVIPDEEFARAFRGWGLDLENRTVAEAAAQIREHPPAVIEEIVAALDHWAEERRRNHPNQSSRKLVDLAHALDKDSARRQLRDLLASGGVATGEDRDRLRQMARAAETPAQSVLTVLLLARLLIVAGEPVAAERMLRAAQTARPKEAAFHEALALFYVRQRPSRWEQAAECLAAARVVRPELGLLLMRTLTHCGRGDEAVSIGQELVKLKPKDPTVWVDYSATLGVLGRYQEAENAARIAVRLRPEAPGPFLNLGLALLHQGRPQDAVDAFRQALGLRPAFSEAQYNLGIALGHQGRNAEAETAIRKALCLRPDYARAWYALGISLGMQARHAEAATVYRRVLDLQRDYPHVYRSLSATLQHLGRYAEAEAAARQARDLAPRDARTHFTLGSALEKLGRYAEAAAAQRAALAIRRDFAEAHHGLGVALGRQGLTHAAAAAHREALRCKADYAEAAANLAIMLYSHGDFSEAREVIEERLKSIRADDAARPSLEKARKVVTGLTRLEADFLAWQEGEKQLTKAEVLPLAMLAHYKGKYSQAARLYAESFADKPMQALGTRFMAARSAVLATVKERGAVQPDEMERSRLRKLALDWLGEELRAWGQRLAAADTRTTRDQVQQQVRRWQQDIALAGVRDELPLARLPQAEQEAWQQFWTDVADLLNRAAVNE